MCVIVLVIHSINTARLRLESAVSAPTIIETSNTVADVAVFSLLFKDLVRRNACGGGD